MSDQGGSRPSLSDLKIDPESRTNNRGARRTLVIAAVGLALIAVAVIVIATRSAPTEVTIASARPAPAAGSQTVLNASGYVTPRRRATVAAKITGRVTEVLVDEGMVVEQGQVLARLDDSDARRQYEAIRAERDVALAAIDELEVNLADARRTLARTLDLHADGVASQQDLDSATAAADALEARLIMARRSLDSAEAQLAVAAQDLENYVIRAPFGGIAVSKDAQPGEMVSPVSAGGGFTRTGISTIVDMQSLEIEVDVNESYIARVSPGQPADAILDAYPEWHIPATVRTIIPTADRQKATVKVRLTFDRLDPKILPDMGIKVAFLELVQKEDGPRPQAQSMIPTSALRRDGSQVVVFIVNDEVVERRAITLGRELGTEVEVVAGVAPGERLVVQNLDSLSDGQRVRVAG